MDGCIKSITLDIYESDKFKHEAGNSQHREGKKMRSALSRVDRESGVIFLPGYSCDNDFMRHFSCFISWRCSLGFLPKAVLVLALHAL